MNTAQTILPARARRLSVVALLLIAVLLVSRTASSWAPEQPAANENPFSRRLPAPEFDAGTQWVNTAAPLTMESLRGRFVLLDFWTYCCINCMQVMPELKKLEHAFPTELVVIGVHSAKFEGEQDTQNIREAIGRHELEHPVVNDGEMVIWRKYGTRSWPTLVLIDPAGDVVWAASGERTFEEMKALLDKGIPYYKGQGLLRPAPRVKVTVDAKASTPLRFPGKVIADEAGARLLITDSNHNRIVVTGLDGRVKSVIGAGGIGSEDGAFDKATFNHPQGLALAGETLYVADSENHRLRKADLAKKTVTTIAGTGEKGDAWSGSRLGDLLQGARAKGPKETALATPWDVWIQGRDLYVAMAGTHQIWKMPLDESTIGPYAGNGREAIIDGELLPKLPYDPGFASFAQPSGLTSDGKRLFIADSEGSIVRSIPFDPAGKAESVVGPTGGTLFEFGDTDGTGEDARFQHPLGVAFYKGKLYVADTYNNKIKVVDVAQRSSRTLAGTRKAGRDDGDGAKATFNEPGGISAADGKLVIADTNNHAIRVIDLTTNRVSTLAIEGLAAPPAPPAK